MKKLILPFLIATGAIINFTGCSTGPGQPEIHQITSIQKELNIKLNFPKKDPISLKTISIKDKDKNLLLNELKNKMYNISNYKTYRVLYYGPVTHLSGIKINYNNKYYNIDYIYTHDYNNGMAYSTEVIFKIPYQFIHNSIIIKYPNKYTYIPANDAAFNKINPLDNPSKLKQDVFNILNKLKNTKLYLSKKYILTGEINTPYPVDSIYANFKRLLGEYKGVYWDDNKVISPVEKKNYFALKIKNKVYPLKIKVYPYRNGSKVVYNAYINYKIYSDGTSTLTKKDIENAKKEIKKVINN